MQKEKSIYADVLESAISWRVRDMYNLYGTIRRVLFEGRKAERAAMLSELIKMQGGNIGGSAKVETPDDRLKLARELENIIARPGRDSSFWVGRSWYIYRSRRRVYPCGLGWGCFTVQPRQSIRLLLAVQNFHDAVSGVLASVV